MQAITVPMLAIIVPMIHLMSFALQGRRGSVDLGFQRIEIAVYLGLQRRDLSVELSLQGYDGSLDVRDALVRRIHAIA